MNNNRLKHKIFPHFMRNKELFNLLKDFSGDDVKAFSNYLKSPYFVKIKSSSDILDEIIKNKNLILSGKTELLVGKICRKYKYSQGAISKQLSYLSKFVLDFLKIKSLLNNKIGSEISLNEYLLNNKDFGILGKKMKSLSHSLNNKDFFEEEEFLLKYKFNVLSYDIFLYSKEFSIKHSSEKKYNILSKAVENITLYSLIQLTSLYFNCFLLDVKYGGKNKFVFPIDLHKIFKEFDNHKFIIEEQKKIIYDILKSKFYTFYYQNNIEYYFNYKSRVQSNLKYLNKYSIFDHFQILMNFCLSKIRLGEENDIFNKEYNELLFQFYDNDYYNVNEQYINPVVFTNFIGRIYSTGDFKKLKLFVDNNAKKLKPEDYNDMVNYGLAYYYLGIKEYNKALKCVNNIPDNQLYYRLDVRNLELRIYYELDKDEFLLAAIHNYHTIITQDNMLTKRDKESLFKMLKYLNKLIQIKNNINSAKKKEDAGYYIKMIKKEQGFSLKKWLLEKYQEQSC